MNKETALGIIKLLSALESWSFSTGRDIPDYLHEGLTITMEELTKIVLEDDK